MSGAAHFCEIPSRSLSRTSLIWRSSSFILSAPLIDHLVDGRPNLIGVFWFDDETQSYLSYDPDPEFAFFNDLETVESRQIFWLRLRSPQRFLGRTRPAGWSVVALP